MATRRAARSASILSGKGAKAFPSKWETDFGRLAFRVFDLSISGPWELRGDPEELPGKDGAKLVEKYLKSEAFAEFLRLSVNGGAWVSIARLTAIFSRPAISVKRLAAKGRLAWEVRAKLKMAIADDAFDAAGWGKYALEALNHHEVSGEHFDADRRQIPIRMVEKRMRAAAKPANVYLPVKIKARFSAR